LNDARNMKTISSKQLCLDIYSSNLISVILADLTFGKRCQVLTSPIFAIYSQWSTTLAKSELFIGYHIITYHFELTISQQFGMRSHYFNPALRSALTSRLLAFFLNFSIENRGFILNTSAASDRASSFRPDQL